MNIRLFRFFNRLVKATPSCIRKWFYIKNGLKIGNGTTFSSDCMIDNPNNINIGEESYINRFCQFHTGMSENATICIGSRTWIGCNVSFICITHEKGDSFKRAGKNLYGSINIGNGSWIGANSIILPNVKIGNGVIIGAGSIVTRNCKDNCLYAGNPVKMIKKLQ